MGIYIVGLRRLALIMKTLKNVGSVLLSLLFMVGLGFVLKMMYICFFVGWRLI